ncbi:NIPA-like protein 3 [Tachysurus ichikawai]
MFLLIECVISGKLSSTSGLFPPKCLHHAIVCLFYRCAVCFLGVFLITKNKKKTKAFEPYVTMDMVKGIPTIHEKGWPVQPDYNGSFSYGTLVNNDTVTPATIPVVNRDTCASPDTGHPYQADEIKKD